MRSIHALSAAARRSLRAAAVFAGAFGVATIFAASRVLFGADAAAAGAIPFVVWFNFGAGFAYLAAAAGLWHARRWSIGLAVAIAIATAAVFVAFGLYVAAGGSFQTRTVYALGLRTTVWVAIALIAAWLLRRKPA